MKRLTKLSLVILLFFFFLNSSSHILAAETVSCKSTVQEKTVTIEVSNVENYLKENPNYDSLYIFVMRKSMGIDTEVVRYKLTKSGEYPFDRTGWPDAAYLAQVNTPPISGKPYGEYAVSNSCDFVLSATIGDLPTSDLCCPEGYQDTDCGHPVNHPFWNRYTECCKYGVAGFWDFKDKIPCAVVEAMDVTCQNGEGVKTALGCIPIRPGGFTNWLLTFAIGIGGGIALLLMIFGALQIIFSGGNPDRVKAGKEMITAAIAGLFLIIFAVVILKLIGQDILQIPDFG